MVHGREGGGGKEVRKWGEWSAEGNPFRASLPMSERSRDAAKSANAAPQNELYAACSYACVCVCICWIHVSAGVYIYICVSIYAKNSPTKCEMKL